MIWTIYKNVHVQSCSPTFSGTYIQLALFFYFSIIGVWDKDHASINISSEANPERNIIGIKLNQTIYSRMRRKVAASHTCTYIRKNMAWLTRLVYSLLVVQLD